MQDILITGGSGLLGSSVVAAASRSYDVTTTYHSNPVSFTGTNCIEVDLTDDEQYDIFASSDIDAIVHCAALTDVDQCEEQPSVAYSHNVDVTQMLVDIAADADARFVYISTDAVFNGKGQFYAESDEPDPINVYGETKREAERRVLSAHHDSVVVRTNIYGWNMTNSQSLAEWILGRLRDDRTVPGFASVYFTPIYTGHLADCILELLERDLSGIYHVTGTERCSKYEFARIVAEVFDLETSLVTKASISDQELSAPRGRDTSLSTDKAQRVLNCTLPDVRTGVQRMSAEET